MRMRSYSTYQVAKLLDVHHTTVINWINVGKLKAHATPGGHRRINPDDLEEFVKRFKIPVSEEIKKERLVLVVDDDAEALVEFREALTGNGFELDFASDGFEAGRKIFSRIPDLILLDFKMPGMDGFEVCETLKMERETSHIPVFAVTALKSESDVKRIKASGVKEYLPKPVNIEKLLKTIMGYLK